MTVRELNGYQLEQLKQTYLCDTMDNVSYNELANAGELVSDEQIYNEYGGVIFCDEDF